MEPSDAMPAAYVDDLTQLVIEHGGRDRAFCGQ
jgi:hypothetical protein